MYVPGGDRTFISRRLMIEQTSVKVATDNGLVFTLSNPAKSAVRYCSVSLVAGLVAGASSLAASRSLGGGTPHNGVLEPWSYFPGP
jgi:hypothetical protein